MTNKIIIIGDSHLVPLKKQLELSTLYSEEKFLFLPHRFLRGMPAKDLIKDNNLYYKKFLDAKVSAFYEGADIRVENTQEIFSVDLDESVIFLVGMGLGVDGLLRGLSTNGLLNKQNTIDLPVYSSVASTTFPLGSCPDVCIYPDDFLNSLLFSCINKSLSLSFRDRFVANNVLNIHIMPLPLITFDVFNYYVNTDLGSLPRHLCANLLKNWFDFLATYPDVCRIYDLISSDFIDDEIFLKSSESFSSKPNDVHMSVNACKQSAEFILSQI